MKWGLLLLLLLLSMKRDGNGNDHKADHEERRKTFAVETLAAESIAIDKWKSVRACVPPSVNQSIGP